MISPNRTNLAWTVVVVFLLSNISLWKCVHCFHSHKLSQMEWRVHQHQMQTIKKAKPTHLLYLECQDADLPEFDDTIQNKYSFIDITNIDLNRRHIIATTPIVTTFWPSIAYSAMTDTNINQIDSSTTVSVLNCLQDLPSFNRTTTVRLFLCRHGETDYNRNNIIQGARIDPPINNVGIQQAKLLGQTLQRVDPTPSSIIFHSPLLRTQQTAQVVAEQMFTVDNNKRQDKSYNLRSLDALAEADFGSVAEGAPVSQYRKELISLYTSWATGNYDAHMKAGGESGTEILQRISKALRTLIDVAAYETDSGSLVAVSHSVYLRLLLGAVQDVAIFSSTSPQANCCINVIDFPHPTTSTTMNRFGTTNEISIPKGNVVRVNEKRHLSLVPLE